MSIEFKSQTQDTPEQPYGTGALETRIQEERKQIDVSHFYAQIGTTVEAALGEGYRGEAMCFIWSLNENCFVASRVSCTEDTTRMSPLVKVRAGISIQELMEECVRLKEDTIQLLFVGDWQFRGLINKSGLKLNRPSGNVIDVVLDSDIIKFHFDKNGKSSLKSR